ncbi:MAG: PIG-L family deacetylase [Bacteroidetes bacterium]|nr:PIG-L family deacetylase [Bacteroidota bacterium]
MNTNQKTVACIVAHPDAETLWAGGTIMSHPSWKVFVVSVFKGNNPDSASMFNKALKNLKSEGIMGNLDDSSEQKPKDEKLIKKTILNLLPAKHFDMIISHNPSSEFMENSCNEVVGKAVIKLWNSGKISADQLWNFAYEDGEKEYYPEAVNPASFYQLLKKEIWMKKYKIITETYGFRQNSWEAETTPRAEAFWQTSKFRDARKWLLQPKKELIFQ